MLHNINIAVMRISECSNIDDLRIHAADGLFLPDLPDQFIDLNRQLNDGLDLWSFDLFKYEQCLIELHRTVVHFQFQYQEAINRVLKHYLSRYVHGETTSNFVLYAGNEQPD
ncbi:unnamed protein product [Rotaria sordida]|uniref:Uncharacterized protein n=3 Tax=Rotaria sordida TaxID=392033 RepID=A0A819MEW7_9BILA|nr:unnamed protein product [Rotaria sordida]